MHIRNAPTKLMKELGYGSGYTYDHDAEGGFSGQNYFPDEMKRRQFYAPEGRGREGAIKERLEHWAKVRAEMIEAGKGRIVNVSTWGTRAPSPLFAAYTASKAALDAFGRSVNTDLNGSGVSVGSVHIPLVRTPMIMPTQREYRGVPSLSADEAAGLVFRAAADSSSRVEPAFVTAVAVADTVAGPLLERAMAREGSAFSNKKS